MRNIFLLFWEWPPFSAIAILSFGFSFILAALPWFLPSIPLSRQLVSLSLFSVACVMVGTAVSGFLALVAVVLIAMDIQLQALLGVLVIVCVALLALWSERHAFIKFYAGKRTVKKWGFVLPWVLVFMASTVMVGMTVLELLHIIGPSANGMMDLPNFMIYPLVFLELLVRCSIISVVQMLLQRVRH